MTTVNMLVDSLPQPNGVGNGASKNRRRKQRNIRRDKQGNKEATTEISSLYDYARILAKGHGDVKADEYAHALEKYDRFQEEEERLTHMNHWKNRGQYPYGEDPTTETSSSAYTLPRLEIEINGRRVAALLDTGAARNFMRTSLAPEYMNHRPQRAGLRTACGTKNFNTRGEIQMEFEVKEITQKDWFTAVDELNENVILGMPWFRKQAVLFDAERKCVHFGENPRQIAYWGDIGGGVPGQEPIKFILPDLPDPIAREYGQILYDFHEVFREELKQATTKAAYHEIRLNRDAAPFRLKPYPLSEEKKQIVNTQIAEMLRTGVIIPSNSNYSSPIVIVKKKDGTPRFCVDYRRLNSMTLDETSQLPSIADTLKELGQAKVFTTLDLKSGYWQIPIHPGSRHLTAFSTPDGSQYEFKVMPFGLKNAPATFQKLMTEVLSGELHKFAKVYLDDVIIYSPDHETHVEHLRRVLERLQVYGLRCSYKKCELAKTELDFLGHRICQDRNMPQVKHVKQISNFPVPKTKKDLQKFLGTVNWIREYIDHASELLRPLTDLLGGNKAFKWGTAQQEAFE